MSDEPPPTLPSDLHYEKWRNQIEQWMNETSVDPKRQALMVRTKLAGRARDIALKLDAGELNRNDGMRTLLQALDSSLRRQRLVHLSFLLFKNIERCKDVNLSERRSTDQSSV